MKINIDTINKLRNKLSINKHVDILTIRGCELNSSYCKWSTELDIKEKSIDYLHLNCLFIVICNNKLIAFKGSSIPNKKYVEKAMKDDGVGCNRLEYGFYQHYAKGNHYPSKNTAHRALRQTRKQPIKRTGDDLDFDYMDRIEVAMVHDNIHASWCKLDATTFGSAGCQVIQGYPKCLKRKENSGHWKKFENWVYSQDRLEFNYLLIPYRWIDRIVNNTMSDLIIFGSIGNNVKEIQKYLKIKIDGVYGYHTYKSILNYQKQNKLLLDGIIGSQTRGKMK